MLDYTLRVRDLVHGSIYFTAEEQRVIDHPLFQRLRYVRQNDVAFLVYPSMNTSRFEYVLGVCHVAGIMAEHITNDNKLWSEYSRSLRNVIGLHSKPDFVRLVRLYALFHDIGHFPFSHLFEMALDRYGRSHGQPGAHIVHGWGGYAGRDHAHEAYGASLTEVVLNEVKIRGAMAAALLRLVREEKISQIDPLSIPKALIASEMDADRIDAYKRDGMLGGGEYGSYDVRRLALSPFLVTTATGWELAYSEKALSSLEALSLDRNRIYQWIHFHHRVVTNKVLAIMLIEEALSSGYIGAEHFSLEDIGSLSFRDDTWLLQMLRVMPVSRNSPLAHAKEALLRRRKAHVLSLWKRTPDYRRLRQSAFGLLGVPEENEEAEKERIRNLDPLTLEDMIRRRLRIEARTFKISFGRDVGSEIPLYNEQRRAPTRQPLSEVSQLVANFGTTWGDEPPFCLTLVGTDVGAERDKLTAQLVPVFADWMLSLV